MNRSEAAKARWRNPEQRAKGLEQIRKLHKSGKDNNFYGKHHTKETIEQINKTTKENAEYQAHIKSDEFRETMSKVSSGKNNPMYERTFYEVWVEKYGKEIADEKLLQYKKGFKGKYAGSKNPMYGKPTPKGAGAGISGWYKGHFFRSLKELTYILLFLDDKEWKSAETKNYRILYKHYDGTERTYCPDFIVGNKLIEVKPKKLHNTPLITLKTEAAIQFCKEHNLEYELVDPGEPAIDQIRKLYVLGEVVFTKPSEKRFITYNT